MGIFGVSGIVNTIFIDARIQKEASLTLNLQIMSFPSTRRR